MKAVLHSTENQTWLFLLFNISMGSFFMQLASAIASVIFAANQLYIMKRRVDKQYEGSWKAYFQSYYQNKLNNLKPKK